MEQPGRAVIWSIEAYRDFESLPLSAKKVLSNRISLIQKFPRLYPVEHEGRRAGLRRSPFERWILFYSYWEDTIYIEFIVPAARDVRE